MRCRGHAPRVAGQPAPPSADLAVSFGIAPLGWTSPALSSFAGLQEGHLLDKGHTPPLFK
jgi:hypothetical protein